MRTSSGYSLGSLYCVNRFSMAIDWRCGSGRDTSPKEKGLEEWWWEWRSCVMSDKIDVSGRSSQERATREKRGKIS